MVEVLVCNDSLITDKLFKSANMNKSENSFCIRAMYNDECLGFCIFEIKGKELTVLYIEPLNDCYLADGLLRTALHIGSERGVSEAFYGDRVDIELLKKLKFLENSKEKRLKFQNLFSECCCLQNN